MIAKSEIRKKMKLKRRTHYVSNIDASYCATKNLLTNLSFSKSDLIGLYWPIKYELDTRPLIKYFSEANFNISLPYLSNKKMVFKKWKVEETLYYNKYNFYSPSDRAITVNPNKIIVPCLAYNFIGNRLGYGKGFYDKYYYNFKKISYIGFAYNFQNIKSLPRLKHDLKLNFIVNESKFHIVR